MAVPDFQSLMLPSLRALSDGADTPISHVRARVAESEHLTQQDLRETVPSGRQTLLTNRVSWAVIYMARAELVARVRRGVYRITAEGGRVLKENPGRIDMRVLRKYPAYRAWKAAGTSKVEKTDSTAQSNEPLDTPEEALERAAQQLRGELEADLLNRVRNAEPAFLEQVVIDLLVAMGYGGGDPDMGRVTGRSGDGGIDGTIREDILGLDEVYVQAKKYAEGKTVGESDLRNFAGAIDAAGTNKGVFVTTAGFTQAARKYVGRSPKRIVLIDGEELARLMVAKGVGVRTRVKYEIRRIDEDYFSEEAQ